MTQSIVDAIKALPNAQSFAECGGDFASWNHSRYIAEQARLSLLMRAVGEWKEAKDAHDKAYTNDGKGLTGEQYGDLCVAHETAEADLRAVYEALK